MGPRVWGGVPKATTALSEDEVIVEDVLDEEDDDEDEDDGDVAVLAQASTTISPCVMPAARVPLLSPSTLLPAGGPSPRPSSLSPHAAPFHPEGSSVGRSKARRWEDADPVADSSDDESAPVASRPSYLDVARKALRARPSPSAGVVTATRTAAAMDGAHRLPTGGKQRQRRRQWRRSYALPPPQPTRVPV